MPKDRYPRACPGVSISLLINIGCLWYRINHIHLLKKRVFKALCCKVLYLFVRVCKHYGCVQDECFCGKKEC